MAVSVDQSLICYIKTRRRHHKSRNGCIECKRRRIKCDEEAPSCTRCVITRKKCIYLRVPTSAAPDRGEGSPSSSSLSGHTILPHTQYLSDGSKSLQTSHCPSPALAVGDTWFNVNNAPNGLSEPDLYHHYLQHTSRTLTLCSSSQWALQIGMPTLALQSKSVFHSVLAVSAACLCCDMMAREPAPAVSTVKQTLMSGYQHYNLASEAIRESMSQPKMCKPDHPLASVVLLVPFATASQRINHWISSKSENRRGARLLASTPKDVIVLARAMQGMLEALGDDDPCSNFGMPQQDIPRDDDGPIMLNIEASPKAPALSHSHVMFSIIQSTSETALVTLQSRLEATDTVQENEHNNHLSACRGALAVLRDIRDTTFSCSRSSVRPASFRTRPIASPQVASWLSSLLNRAEDVRPACPLTRFLINFLFHTPQAYINLVLPLLDQRLEGPLDTLAHQPPLDLTVDQALALDIYAHWSVLMFLAEEEAWWIGSLAFVSLCGLVKRYGEDFVSRSWPETCAMGEQWWPGRMLSIARDIRRFS